MFGAILGMAGAVYGSVQQRKADKKAFRLQEANTQKAMDLLNAGETRASDFLKQALAAIQQGNQQALGQTAQAEFQGYRALQDQLGGGQSRLAQSLAGRGLYGSSVGRAGQRSLYADYGRAVGDLGAQLGGVRAGIAQQGAEGAANVYGNMAQNAGNFAQARAGIQSNIQYQGQQGLAENYGALGAAAGELLGGAADAWGSWASRRGGSAMQRFGFNSGSPQSRALRAQGYAMQNAGRVLGPTPWGFALQGAGGMFRKAGR
jgi:hypothetical protein